MSRPDFGFIPESAISPMEEIGEPEFTLDMNLDDMSGIVDPTRANGPPAAGAPPGHNPSMMSVVSTTMSEQSTTSATTAATSSSHLQEALNQAHSPAASQSGSDGSGDFASGLLPLPGRSTVKPPDRTSADSFTRSNPFNPPSPHGSIDGKSRTAPSSQTLTLSPKFALPLNNQPRRPSHLRNMKLGSMTSDDSNEGVDFGNLQPIAPIWAQGLTSSGSTMFHDPFRSNALIPDEIPEGVSPSHSIHQASSSQAFSQKSSTDAATSEAKAPTGVAPAIAGPSAAGAMWAAPESWGVEGDELPDEATSSEEDDWAEGEGEEPPSPPLADSVGELMQPSTSSSSRHKPPPFGFKSAGRTSSSGSIPRPGTAGGRKSRVKTSSGRPSTAQRPLTSGRPGTSGSAHINNTPVSLSFAR